MANMMDYLIWRGDLTFRQAPFNEVDNLILAELVYVDFSGIVPENDNSITLAEASEIFFRHHTEEEIEEKVSSTKAAAFVMREMAKTARFASAELSRYREEIDLKEQSQFCAMNIRLDDDSIFVSYSGTDNTIVGWKENFNMSFLDETPGQLKAVEYLNESISMQQKVIRVGGHSKGGNLAVYAAVHCKPSIQDRIAAVYSNDGPGFTDTMISRKDYHRLLSRIHTIIPESSIVGMILEHEEEYEVIKSSGSGPTQHDAMTWEVQGGSFVYVKSVAQGSVLLDRTLKAWIGKMDHAQREEFVDALFSVLDEAQIRTVDDLAKMNWKKFAELLRVKNSMSRENQKVVAKTLRMLWEESNRTIRSAMKRKMTETERELP